MEAEDKGGITPARERSVSIRPLDFEISCLDT